MAAEKVDRRVRYTKRALTQALVRLVQERPVSKISVKELCERADVNRSTFYAHFRNPHDLLQSIENDALADQKAHLLADDKPRTASVVKVLEYAQDNAEVFLMLLEESDGGFQRQIMVARRDVGSAAAHHPARHRRTRLIQSRPPRTIHVDEEACRHTKIGMA